MVSIDRRTALQLGFGGSIAAYALSQMPMLASAAAIPEVNATPEFIWLSSKLIHVKEEMIAPTVPQDGRRLCDLYYSLLKDAATTTAFQKFEEKLKDVKDKPFDQNLLGKSGEVGIVGDSQKPGKPAEPATTEIAWASRMTMMMWLFGAWYGGEEIRRLKRKDPQDNQAIGPTESYFSKDIYKKDFVISSRAYANGWIWRMAQAHPMGVSQFAFGSWAEVPPELVDYGFDLTT
jgi:hypothetical protein